MSYILFIDIECMHLVWLEPYGTLHNDALISFSLCPQSLWELFCPQSFHVIQILLQCLHYYSIHKFSLTITMRVSNEKVSHII